MRGLKVTLALFGAVLCAEGLLDIAIPITRASRLGLGACASQAPLAMTVLGVTWLTVGGFMIGAARAPGRHQTWVRFAVVLPIALAIGLLLAALRGQVTIGQIAVDLAFDVVFAALLAAFALRRTHLRGT